MKYTSLLRPAADVMSGECLSYGGKRQLSRVNCSFQLFPAPSSSPARSPSSVTLEPVLREFKAFLLTQPTAGQDNNEVGPTLSFAEVH